MMTNKQSDMPAILTSHPNNQASTDTTDIYAKAMDALRKADFNLLMDSIRNDHVSLHEVFENIKVYQAELVIQNEELINSQFQAESAATRFMHLFASLPLAAFVVEKSGAIVQVNDAAKLQLRLHRMPSAKLYLHSMIQAKDHLRFKRLLDEVRQQPQQVMSQTGVEFKSTPLFIGDLYVSSYSKPDDPIPLYVVMVVDQTAAITQQRALEAQKKHFSAYFNTSPVGMCALDSNKNWIEFNQALSDLLGYDTHEMAETSWRTLTFSEDVALESRQFAKLSSGECHEFECDKRFIKQDGSLVYAHIVVSCLRKPSLEIDYFVVIVIDITNRKIAEERMQFLAHHDTLTYLPNRTLLENRFKLAKSFAMRHKNLMAVIYLDLDHFKNINDSLGHLVGDNLLVQVAQRLKSCIRDTDTICRLGGDEFLILLGNLDDADSVAKVSAKLLDELSQPFKIETHTLNITCSIGVAFYPLDGESFEMLLQNADIAMYQAKSKGRNHFQLFTPAMNIKAQERLYLENEMRKALQARQFTVAYQPQMNMATSEIVGVEALLRWQHSVMGAVTPNIFIPIAEDSGLILDLGEFVLEQACEEAYSLFKQGKPLTVSVNISVIQLQRGDVVGTVTKALQQKQFPPHLLELEITESVLASDPDKVVSVVHALKQLGVRFAIDDFGAGYSSFNYLKRFNVDKLKIDRSFIADIMDSHEGKIIVSAMIQLAHCLEMECLAEGVETEAQMLMLKSLECDYIQGFIYAKPMGQEALQTFIN